MAVQVQTRRGTSAEHSSFTGANGEITVDTDKEVVVVHDGATVGGYPLMRENGSNSALALGSAGTPSLKFTGDLNTGIYSPGADQVAISTNGSGRLFVDASGRVGVGTSPSYALHVSGTGAVSSRTFATDATGDASFFVQNDGNGICGPLVYGSTKTAYGALASNETAFYSNRSTTIMADGASAAIKFATGGNTERLRITSAGAFNFTGAGTAGSTQAVSFNGSAPVNSMVLDSSGRLGIGTSAPTDALHLASGNLVLTNGSSFTTANSEIRRISSYAGAANQFETTRISSITGAFANRGELAFSTGDDTSFCVEKVRIDYLGRVGIGTTPGYILDVANGNVSGAKLFKFTGATAGGSLFGYSDAGGVGITRTDPYNSMVYFDTGNTIQFYTGSTQRAQIDSSGRLLVGTSTGGTSTGSGQLRLGGAGIAGGALFLTNHAASVANNGTVDLTVGTSSIIIYVGFLIVHSANSGTNGSRTQTTFSVFGSPQNSSFTATQIATATGAGTSTFTVTSPSAGVIRITNTSGVSAHMSMCFMGTGWFMD